MHRRKLYIKFELKNKIFHSILKNQQTTLSNRYLVSLYRSALPKSSVTRIVNRCTRTGRSYNVLKKVQLSRFPFRFESYNGTLPGVRRHSW